MRRISAYKDFDTFYSKAKETFESMCDADPIAKKLGNRYSFCAVPGGAMGGVDKRLVEIFYGYRPFDQITTIRDVPGSLPVPVRKGLIERGACLWYKRTDSGEVLCFLYPATTEELKQEEEFIFLERIRNPADLLDQCTLERHWRAFISYMNCTNIDAASTSIDVARIWFLRKTRKLGVDGRLTSPAYRQWLGKIGSYVLTIGLSGFLLAFITFYFGSKESEEIRMELAVSHVEVHKLTEKMNQQAGEISALELKLAQTLEAATPKVERK